MGLSRASRQYLGVRALLPPDLQYALRNPTSSDKAYVKGTLWLNTASSTAFMWPGTGDWISLGSGTTGAIVTLTGNTGGAISPVGGNISILGGSGVTVTGTAGTLTIALTGGGIAMDSFVPDAGTNPVVPSALGVVTMAGTANQITTTGGVNTLTFSIPSAFIAPGSIASTTTITSGTALVATTTLTAGTGITSTTGNIVASAGNITATLGSVAAGTTVTAGTAITATLGNITATNGNIVLTAAGNKMIRTSVATTTTAGANSTGTVVLVGGTATVSTTSVATGSQVRIWRQSVGATGAAALGQLSVGTITNGTSFIINAWSVTDATSLQTSDVSVIGWDIVN